MKTELDSAWESATHNAERATKAEHEIERLRAELAACQQDAERYRWWRKYFEGNSPDMPDAVCAVRTPAELDAAIDTARKGEAE